MPINRVPNSRIASRPPDPSRPREAGTIPADDPVEIYLPIADLPVNVFLIFAMGIAVGFISGMFGIGGGFLMTPLLIFVGISPAVARATSVFVASCSPHCSPPSSCRR